MNAFLDTNVFVYADDRANPDKQRRAQELIRELLRSRTGAISLQVLQEYFAAATRKLGIPAEAARRRIEVFARFDVIAMNVGDMLAAIDLHRLHGFSIWDGLIVRAALVAGCRRLYSEDLQHGFRVENLEIVNPFGAPNGA